MQLKKMNTAPAAAAKKKTSNILIDLEKLTPENKDKIAKEFNTIIKSKATNVEKLDKIKTIVIRVTDAQKTAYNNLAKVTNVPLSQIVRKSLNEVINKQITVYKLSTKAQAENFKAFQKKMGLID